MSALPTLGGNNGQASAINSQGEIAGVAETPEMDLSCPSTSHIFFPVLWHQGTTKQFGTVAGEPDGAAVGINDLGQVVGGAGNCSIPFCAVLWQDDGTAVALPSLASPGSTAPNQGMAINNRGQIVGFSSPDNMTFYAVLWENGTVTNLGAVPEDFASLATGINVKGQVVGTSFDENFNPAHAFIWQRGVMTDHSTLFPASSNLFPTMANKINSSGQISGMATVLAGPHAGEIHAFLASPVNASIASSVAAVAIQHPNFKLPANVRKQLLQRLGLGRLGR